MASGHGLRRAADPGALRRFFRAWGVELGRKYINRHSLITDHSNSSMSNQQDPDGDADGRRDEPAAPRPDPEEDEAGERRPPETPGAPGESSEQLEEDEELLDGSDLGSEVHVDAEVEIDEDSEDDLLGGLQAESSEEIKVPDRLVDQVIGQDHARDIVLKAAKQRRHVMMIGSPGRASRCWRRR